LHVEVLTNSWDTDFLDWWIFRRYRAAGMLHFSERLYSRCFRRASLLRRGILKRLVSSSRRGFIAGYRHRGDFCAKKRTLSVSSHFIANGNVLLRAPVIRHVTSSNQERQFREDKVGDLLIFPLQELW